MESEDFKSEISHKLLKGNQTQPQQIQESTTVAASSGPKEPSSERKKPLREIMTQDASETQVVYSSSASHQSFEMDEAKFVEKQINGVLKKDDSPCRTSVQHEDASDIKSTKSSPPPGDKLSQRLAGYVIQYLENRFFEGGGTSRASSVCSESELFD